MQGCGWLASIFELPIIEDLVFFQLLLCLLRGYKSSVIDQPQGVFSYGKKFKVIILGKCLLCRSYILLNLLEIEAFAWDRGERFSFLLDHKRSNEWRLGNGLSRRGEGIRIPYAGCRSVNIGCRVLDLFCGIMHLVRRILYRIGCRNAKRSGTYEDDTPDSQSSQCHGPLICSALFGRFLRHSCLWRSCRQKQHPAISWYNPLRHQEVRLARPLPREYH